jgi:formylglycine-generating enzyme required for sulfatase activity
VADALDPLGVPLHPQPRGRASRPLSTPVQEKLQKEVLGLVQQTAGGKVQIPRERKEVKTAGVGRPSVLALAVRLLVPTLVLGSLIALGVWKKGIGQETREHVEAYRLQNGPFEGAESPRRDLIVDSEDPSFPVDVILCGDAQCSERVKTLKLTNGRTAFFEVERQKEDRRYHVRARLANGVWGYSKQVLVAGYTPPPVGELLVHFVSEGKSVEKATFAVTDATGKAVQAESDKRLALRSGPVRIVGEVKPYAPFEKAAEVKKDTLETVTIDLGKLPPPPGMVEIPAGSFLMGSNDGDADEKPVHRVTLPTYYFDQYEVTMDDYQKCVRAGRCSSLEKTVKYEGYSEEDVKKWSPFCNVNQRGKGRHPVNCVDWSQAAAYCKWAGKRLPTEEEWEYAARGTDGRKYPWGNEAPRAGLLNACGSECIEMSKTKGFDGWKSMYSGNDGWEMTAPVGSVKGDKSPFGVMDLGGNVTEWVQDWYRDSYQKSDGPTKKRSLRGASWLLFSPSFARAPNRIRDSPGNRNSFVGFRCARTK